MLTRAGITCMVVLLRASSGSLGEPMAVSQWQAKWIWCAGEESPRNFYIYIRKTFQLPDDPTKAIAHVSADSRYKLYVNGEFVGRGPARCYPEYQYYDSHDIGRLLHKGTNVISALVHQYGDLAHDYSGGNNISAPGRGGFLLQAEITLTDGRTINLFSDSSWKVKPASCYRSDTLRASPSVAYVEVLDARDEPQGWTGLNFDDSQWPSAVEIGAPPVKPWTRLIPRDIPYLHEEELLPARVIATGKVMGTNPANFDPTDPAETMDADRLEPDPSKLDAAKDLLNIAGEGITIESGKQGVYLVLDFGREVTGFPRLELEGTDGGIVDMGCSELLDGDRVIARRDLVHYADRYVMRDGAQSWELFSWKGFRYMQLTFRNCQRPVKLKKVALNHLSYPLTDRGAFECSDPLLNEIWRIGADTVRLCMHDAYEDCPWREQAQWVGDAHIEALVNYYAFGDTKLAAKYIRQVGQSQCPDGLTTPVAPSQPWPPEKRIPGFCLYWINSIWDYYLYCGDLTLLQEVFPKVEKAISWFEEHINEDGLLDVMQGWLFTDWTRNIDDRFAITVLNFQYYSALLDAAEIAGALGNSNKRLRYSSQATEMKKAINQQLWSNARELYVDYKPLADDRITASQHANALAVLFGLAEEDKVDTIIPVLLSERDDVAQVGTYYFTHYVLSALFCAGRVHEAIDLIRTRWGRMLDAGATTWWETFRPPRSDSVQSACHGWSASSTYQLPAEILGVKPAQAGFATVEVRPAMVDLAWAKGSVPSPRGDIRVSWQRDDKEFRMSVDAPQNTKVIVAVPTSNPSTAKITMNGQTVWDSGQVSCGAVTRFCSGEANAVRIETQGGKQYEIVCRDQG